MQQCVQCGAELKQIPAGVSKTTGRPYQAFVTCPNRCGQTKPQQSITPAKTKNSVNWDEIARGKVRHGIVCAMLQAGKDYDTIATNLLRFENLIMGNKTNQPQSIPTIQIEDEYNTEDIPF